MYWHSSRLFCLAFLHFHSFHEGHCHHIFPLYSHQVVVMMVTVLPKSCLSCTRDWREVWDNKVIAWKRVAIVSGIDIFACWCMSMASLIKWDQHSAKWHGILEQFSTVLMSDIFVRRKKNGEKLHTGLGAQLMQETLIILHILTIFSWISPCPIKDTTTP